MIHLLPSNDDQFYWLSIVKKANTYEENGRSTETFTQKHNCEKSIKNEAEQFDGDKIDIMDHTGKSVMFYSIEMKGGKWIKSKKQKVTEKEFNVSIREVQFVQQKNVIAGKRD